MTAAAGDVVVVLGVDDDALAVVVGAADVDGDGAAVGVDESLPRVTKTVAATAITTTASAPPPSNPHRGPRGGAVGAGG